MPHNMRRYTGIFAHAGLQRARESAIRGDARRAAKALEAEGKGGDKYLIHVNDEELTAIRSAFGPSGSPGRPNPVTGLESFAPDDGTTGAASLGTNPDGSGYTIRLPLDAATADATAEAAFRLLSNIPRTDNSPQSSSPVTIATGSPTAGRVVLSDGRSLLVPDENGQDTVLRSPDRDLNHVSASARATRQRFLDLLNGGHTNAALGYLAGKLFRDVGPGGTFDYQREGSSQLEGLLGDRMSSLFKPFDQRREYQPVSNFNVGLYAQQAGLPLEDVLHIGDFYSLVMSNLGSKRPPELTPIERNYITQGSLAGGRGDFDSPGRTQQDDP